MATTLLTLRRLVPSDAADYRALMLAACEAHADAFTSAADEAAQLPLDHWAARLSPDPQPAVLVVGAFADARLVGAVGLSFESRRKVRHKATLFGLHVACGHQRTGLGRRLMDAVLAEAAARAGVRVVVLTVSEGNAAAQALYRRCGFDVFGREPLAVAGDAGFIVKLHMQCALPAAGSDAPEGAPSRWLSGDFPVLHTPRLVLRELAPSDAGAILAIHGDAEAMQWFGCDPVTELGQAQLRIAEFVAMRHAARPGVRWALEDRASGGLIGTCGLFHWDRGAQTCSLGYELARNAWRQGFMREALARVLAFGFDELALHRIEARVHPDNQASLRVVDHFGFVREGRLREVGRWMGARHDLLLFALLRQDRADGPIG